MAESLAHASQVRHGQSIANVDPTLFTTMAEAGKDQARECGKQIRNYLLSLNRPTERLCRLWTSPYTRARETSRILKEECGDVVHDVREGVLLGEQQFGLFEGVDWKELERFYPNEVAFYRKSSSFGGRFWARMPLGESRFDVCQRVHQSFGAFHRDAERHGIQDLIIVSHGVTLRAFQMMWQDLSPEWFEAEPNPRNCSIRVLSGNNTDEGYIWGGPEVPEYDSQNLLLKYSGKAVAG